MFKIRSDVKKKPIEVQTIEQVIAITNIVKKRFNRELLVETEIDISDVFHDESCLKEVEKFYNSSHPDVIILGLDLAQIEQKEDFKELLMPIINENLPLVTQYKSGNEKSLNALLGKFLKTNRDYEPKEIKEELIKIIGEI